MKKNIVNIIKEALKSGIAQLDELNYWRHFLLISLIIALGMGDTAAILFLSCFYLLFSLADGVTKRLMKVKHVYYIDNRHMDDK